MSINFTFTGAAAVVLGAALIGCSAVKTQTLDRKSSEKCNTESAECKRWTELAIKCDDNSLMRDAGYMGSLEPWCLRAEEYREQVTGVELSNAPGAHNF